MKMRTRFVLRFGKSLIVCALAGGLAACTGARGVSALAAGPAGTGGAQLPSGEYDCSQSASGGIVAMAKVDIKGSTYRYRPYGEVKQGFAPYTLGADGKLKWGGKMGALDAAPSVLLGSEKMDWGFRVHFRSTPGGYAEDMDCQKM